MNKNKVFRKRRQKEQRAKLISDAFKRIYVPTIQHLIYKESPFPYKIEDKIYER